MARSTPGNKRARRKEQQKKDRRQRSMSQAQNQKSLYYYYDALRSLDLERHDKAVVLLEKAIKLNPSSREAIDELISIGITLKDDSLIARGLLKLYEQGMMHNIQEDNENILFLCQQLGIKGQHGKALEIALETYKRFDTLKVKNRKKYLIFLKDFINYTSFKLDQEQRVTPAKFRKADKETGSTRKATDQQGVKRGRPAAKTSEKTAPEQDVHKSGTGDIQKLPEVSIVFESDASPNGFVVTTGPSIREEYDLVMDAVRIRFKETFDHLLCLNSLKDIRSLVYQEETARKVLKTFRGRALLADEVGMGKTIEACMVLKEYILRRMVKNALILAPTPLVSQWQEELRAKFQLEFKSTDDSDFRGMGSRFWQEQYVVVSINTAKSKRNFEAVTGREWDMVIIDEAHHLKNRNTLNWKLANTLRKRFLLLLTATPVENNLMELYNLITLLKPGQLKTVFSFKEEFMTRGDPTDPKNRQQLKGLLDQVMIRNTRAVANIHIPPRFAETVRVEPTDADARLYGMVSGLVQEMNVSNGHRSRMMLKHILAGAGSSPAAVERSLNELLTKQSFSETYQGRIREIQELAASIQDTGKNRMLLKLIRSVREKVIVFVKYRATLDHLSEILQKNSIKYSLFHGQLPNDKKDREIEKFKEGNHVLLTTELGGEGRNLQFCHRMINYDLPWNPMRIEQRIGRIHRIGQEHEVLIYNLCAAGTIEDYILEILDRKINMFELVVGEIDMIIGRMRGEQEFSDIIYDIWINSGSGDELKKAFDKLGSKLKRSRTGYEKTKSLDEKLFGENYEI